MVHWEPKLLTNPFSHHRSASTWPASINICMKHRFMGWSNLTRSNCFWADLQQLLCNVLKSPQYKGCIFFFVLLLVCAEVEAFCWGWPPYNLVPIRANSGPQTPTVPGVCSVNRSGPATEVTCLRWESSSADTLLSEPPVPSCNCLTCPRRYKRKAAFWLKVAFP